MMRMEILWYVMWDVWIRFGIDDHMSWYTHTKFPFKTQSNIHICNNLSWVNKLWSLDFHILLEDNSLHKMYYTFFNPSVRWMKRKNWIVKKRIRWRAAWTWLSFSLSPKIVSYTTPFLSSVSLLHPLFFYAKIKSEPMEYYTV